MKMCRHMKTLFGLAALAAVFGAGLLLDSGSSGAEIIRHLPAVSPAEHARTIESMRPPKRARPVIAILGHNAGTETTDYLVPYGVLVEADVADVVAVAPDA